MFSKDSNFIVTFQLALIGVVLVGGLFLIWRAMTRLEEKLDLLTFEKDSKNMQFFREQMAGAFGEPSRMPEVFEEGTCPMAYQPPHEDPFYEERPPSPPVQSHPQQTGPLDQFVLFTTKVEEVAAPEPEPEPAPSCTSIEPLSKNKLRSMTVDKLKKICEDKKIDPEGTKNQLIDKILAE
jgi:hypothetical protein